MIYFKHRAWPGVLALVCLITGFLNASPLPVMNGQAIAADTGPDLIIQSISWSPEAPALKDTVTFTTTIKNQGDSQAAPSRIGYYIDNNLIGTADINQIDAGNTAVSTFNWQTIAGEHSVKAVIDSDNIVPEVDENNNVKIYAFSVLAADLVIESITWLPQKPSVGDSVTFSVTMKNRGNKTAGVCSMEFFIDGSSRGQLEVKSLEPGSNSTLAYKWVAQAGQHTLQATADVFNQVTESDETNNSLTLDYTTTPPDLYIQSITWAPINRTDTDNVTMSVTVKNKGYGDAYGSWMDFYIDDELVSSVFVDSLNTGAVSTQTYTWLVGAEEHTFTAIIDANNWVAESNEANNTYKVTLPALGPPDLLVQSVTWSPTIPLTNSQMTFTITVKNQGQIVVNKCELDFYLEYGYKVNKQIGPISAGGTANVSIQYITSDVPINVRAIVDPNNHIIESNEENNEKEASLTPAEPTPVTDLNITSFTWTPGNPKVGDTVTITVKIKNSSSKKVGESRIAYYIDGTLLDTVLTRKLNANATATYSITWTATAGTHIIRVVADYGDAILETNESNNIVEKTISALTPDLAIQSITWSPEIPAKGDTLTITLTIVNRGNLKSSGCYVNYYIDGSSQGRHYVDEIPPGGTVTRTFPWTLINDSQTFKAVIDEENSVIETDEANNTKTAVLPAPDFIIESITYSPSEFSENGTVTLSIIVRNTGAGQSESMYLGCYINDNLQTRLPVNSIPAGESVEVVFSWTALPGENVFKAVIDGDDYITESNEGNNEKSIDLYTQAPIEEITIPPETDEEIIDDTTSNETQENIPVILDTDDLPPALAEEIFPTDVIEGISSALTGALPSWQNILTNRNFVIGVGVLGGASILILLLLRKKTKAA